MSWEDRPQAKKGMVGEAIVDDWLRSHGFIPYFPSADGPHPFDRLCASADKRTIFVADAKAKAARQHYPDTGINIRHYNDYMHIRRRYLLHVFIFFVDEKCGRVYGNFIAVLDRPRTIRHAGFVINYPLEKNGIRYWPLEAMRHIADLTPDQTAELKRLSTRNPAYDGMAA